MITTYSKLTRDFASMYANFLIGHRCVICKAPTRTSITLCKTCVKSFLYNKLRERIHKDADYCKLCGRPLISESEYCITCKSIENKEEHPYLKTYTLFPYTGNGQKIVAEWKIAGLREYASLFAGIITEFVKSQGQLEGSIMVPIPPRPDKIKKIGWDQINDIATRLKGQKLLPVSKVLKRRNGPSQKSVSEEERKTNLIGKFYTRTKAVIPKKVIIFDDIFTSGSTLYEAAKTLKQAGCQEVYGLALFFD